MSRRRHAIALAAATSLATIAIVGGLAMAALLSSQAPLPDDAISPPKAPSVSIAPPPTNPTESGQNSSGGDGSAVIATDCAASTLAAPTNEMLTAALRQISISHGAEFSASWYRPDAGVMTAGDLTEQPAWSTSKVPLSLAVIQSGQGDALTPSISAALRWSDNDAADTLWQALGADDVDRAQAVTDVLRDAGDEATTVPTTANYPPFSIYGQTQWSAAAQVGFLTRLPCLAGSGRVIAEMSNVTSAQHWGLGELPGAVFKGGWGPYAGGGYLVRQFGWYPDQNGSRVPVAFVVHASSFDAGVDIVNEMTAALAS